MASLVQIITSLFQPNPPDPGNTVMIESVGRGMKTGSYELYQTPGIVGLPCPNDIGIGETIGEVAAITAVNDYNFSLAPVTGEVVIYSRDGSGLLKSYTWYKTDGTILTTNTVGTTTIDPSGLITITNGTGTYTIDPSGTMKATNGSGTHEIVPDGTHKFNNGTISAVKFTQLKSGFDELKSNFNSFVSTFNNHIHTTTATVGLAGPATISIPTTPGSDSSASIDSSEVSQVKFP